MLDRRGVRVRAALVGPVSEELAKTLSLLAEELGVDGRVSITGEISEADCRRYLGEASVAVQLRDRFSGECSGTVSECLTAGIATVVARIRWFAELPGDVAVSVGPACGSAELADAIALLVTTARRRLAMARAGQQWAARRTFDDVATAVLEALSLGSTQRRADL